MIKSLERIIQLLKNSGTEATLIRGAGGALFAKILGTGLAFGLQVLLADLLGAEVYGQYIYVFTWVTILSLLSKLGFDTGSLKFVATYCGQKKWNLLSGFIKRTLQITIIVSVLVGIIAAGITWLLRSKINIDLLHTFWIGFIALPAMACLELYSAQLQALKRVVFAQIPKMILRPVFLGSSAFITIKLIEYRPSAPLIFGFEFIIICGACFIAWRLLSNYLPPEIVQSKVEYQTVEWLRVSSQLLIIAAFQLILNHTDVLMIGFYCGTTDAGIYSVASMIAKLMILGLVTIDMIVAPMISELYAKDRMAELQRIVSLAALGILVISIASGLIIIIFGQFILGMFGTAFKDGYLALVIIASSQMFNALAGSLGFLMTMTRYHSEAAKIIGFSALLNIILNMGLIPVYGMAGAAIATAITTVCWNVSMFLFVRKRLNINPTVFSCLKLL